MIRIIRQYLAKRRLARIAEQTRKSYEAERYRRNRAAQMKGKRRLKRVPYAWKNAL